MSLLQRALGVGYGRGARLIDFMAEDGVVGAYAGSQARDVLLAHVLQLGGVDEATAGVAAPVLSTIEDVTSVSLTFIAILIPALVAVVLIALAVAAVWLLRRRRRRRLSARTDAKSSDTPPI